MLKGKVSKADGRKHSNSNRKANYAGNFPFVARRKDANVRRSSHGKFPGVAALVAHQMKVSPTIESQRQKQDALRRAELFDSPPAEVMWGLKRTPGTISDLLAALTSSVV